MSFESEYRGNLENIEDSLESAVSRHRATRIKSFLDYILPVALLSLTFVIVFSIAVQLTEQVRVYVSYLNWAVILYFASRLIVELRLSDNRERFIQNHWFDFALVIPAFSFLKQIKILELVSEFDLLEQENALISAKFFREAVIATEVTRITRIVKRSIGL